MVNEVWRESLHPKIALARAALAAVAPQELALRAGLQLNPEGLRFVLAGRGHLLTWPDCVVREENGNECPEEVQALVLDYLVRSDGSPPTQDWKSFDELPHGSFYNHAFQGYTGDELVRLLGGNRVLFERGSQRLGGIQVSMGDAGYVFWGLPRIPVALVWWEGEEGIPPAAKVLFDAVASRYLPTDGLAILGRMLCRRIVKEAGAP